MSGPLKHFAHFEPYAKIVSAEVLRKEDLWKQACHFGVSGKHSKAVACSEPGRLVALTAIPAITGKRHSPSLISRDSHYHFKNICCKPVCLFCSVQV
jgi:hypothetical protein